MAESKKDNSQDQNENDNSGQLQEHTGTAFGSFTNNDQESDSSIGTGTSDQGIEPGDEEKEDENRSDITGSSAGAGFFDGTNEVGGQRGNSGGPIGNLAGKYDTNSSSAGGSGTMEKGNGGISRQPEKGLVEEGPGPDA